MNKRKPLINCVIETNKENNYFKFVKVDEKLRNDYVFEPKFLSIFDNYKIYSSCNPGYDSINNFIWIFGINKIYDNIIVDCDKNAMLALQKAGCKVIVKENTKLL